MEMYQAILTKKASIDKPYLHCIIAFAQQIQVSYSCVKAYFWHFLAGEAVF